MKTITLVNFIAVIIVVFACNHGRLFKQKKDNGGANPKGKTAQAITVVESERDSEGKTVLPTVGRADGKHSVAAADSSVVDPQTDDNSGRPKTKIDVNSEDIPADQKLQKYIDDLNVDDFDFDYELAGGHEIEIDHTGLDDDDVTDHDDTTVENLDRGNYDPATDPTPSANALLHYGDIHKDGAICGAYFLPKPGDEAKEEYESNVFVTMAKCIVNEKDSTGFKYKGKMYFQLQLSNDKYMKNFIDSWLPCEFYKPGPWKPGMSTNRDNIGVVIMKTPIPVKKDTEPSYIIENNDWMKDEDTEKFINEGFNRMKSK